MEVLAIFYLATGLITALLAFYLAMKHPSKKVAPFIFLGYLAAFCSVLHGITYSLSDPDLMIIFIKVQFMIAPFIPALWIIFALDYAGHNSYYKKLTLGMILFIPTLICVLLLSGNELSYIFTSFDMEYINGALTTEYSAGPIIILMNVYYIVAYIIGLTALFNRYRYSKSFFKKQTLLLICIGIEIVILNITGYIIELETSQRTDLTPLAYLMAMILAVYGMRNLKLFAMMPLSYTKVFEKIPDGLIVVDQNGYIVEVNQKAEVFLNKSAEVLKGHLLSESDLGWYELEKYLNSVIRVDTDTDLVVNFEECSSELTYTYEAKGKKRAIADDLIDADESTYEKTYHISVTMLMDEVEKSCESIVILIRDITAQKSAEKRLFEDEIFYRDLFEQSPVGYLTLDMNRKITSINSEFYLITSYSESDLVGFSISDLIRKNAKSKRTMTYSSVISLLDERWDLLIKYGKYNGELEFLRHDGKRITIDTISRVQYDHTGKPIRVHAVILDITERKLMEKTLAQANNKLSLLSGITRHDISNQLAVMEGYQELISDLVENSQNTDVNAENPESLDIETLSVYINKQNKALTAIHKQIAFSKDYQDVGVRACTWQNVVSVYMHAASLLDCRNVNVSCSESMKGIEIYADPLLEKVFYNLVDNSLRYGGEKLSKISLRARIDEGILTLLHEDDGEGIPNEHKENIFNRVYFHHSGNGLFLSREILGITSIGLTETGLLNEGARFEMKVPNDCWRCLGVNEEKKGELV